MGLFSSPKESLQAFVRVDSIGISFVVYSLTSQKVSYSDTCYFFQNIVGDRYDFLVKQVQLSLHTILEKVQTRSIDKVTIIFSEPWSHSIRRQVSYQRKTSFKITQNFIQDIINRDQKKVIQELHINDIHNQNDLMDPYYLNFSISGHQVENPWNRVVNNITIDYTTGFSDQSLSAILKTIIHEKLKIPLLNIYTQHYQNFLLQFSRKLQLDHALIIDWSGYTTDVSVLQQKTFTQTGTLPQGIVSLKQDIAKLLLIPFHELDTLLQLYQKGLLSEKVIFQIESVLEKVFIHWEEDFQIFCANAVTRGDVMYKIFWTNNNDSIVQFFMNRLSQDTALFPVLFGSTQVTFIPIQDIFNSSAYSILGSEYSEQDKIIISTLFK